MPFEDTSRLSILGPNVVNFSGLNQSRESIVATCIDQVDDIVSEMSY
jgi:hypothetical protein